LNGAVFILEHLFLAKVRSKKLVDKQPHVFILNIYMNEIITTDVPLMLGRCKDDTTDGTASCYKQLESSKLVFLNLFAPTNFSLV
jgi:hypothetical protein